MVLQDMQAALRFIPKEAVDAVSEWLSVPRSQVYSVASFYKALSLEPRGKHRIDVCLGTACHVRGAPLLVHQLSRELGVEPGATTPDGEVTLSTVNCVGACAMGPVVVMDGEYHGEMTPARLLKQVKKCCSGEGSSADRRGDIFSKARAQVAQRPSRRLDSIGALEDTRAALRKERPPGEPAVLVCAGTGCVANGSMKVAEALGRELRASGAGHNVELMIKKTGCHGFCEKGPLVVFHPGGTIYTRVKPADATEIVEKTVLKNEVLSRLLYRLPGTDRSFENYRRIPFYAGQQRNVLRNIGRIDPEDIRDYFVHGGYAALAKVLSTMTPDEVIDEVERSGIRGCGGGGFPTGRKWRSCVNAPGEVRYIICNADEGDPGAFMDRSILEGDPHAVIEGMLIGAYAIGAREGFIYVRDEYPLAVARFATALEEARLWGLLGERILGTDLSFDVRISRGGGSFVCGESSALMQSVAGKVGEPRAKYIRSTERGLHDQPTVLNNVETFANVPLILERGAEWFAAIGTEKSKGTKAFALVGKVNNTGLVEVPMGTTLRTIIFDIGGGMRDGRKFKAVQTGGPSGGCLPENKLDLPVDFDSLTAEGSMMGSGGMIVMDDATCMVDVARYFTTFLTEESCGKCAACRLGLAQMKEILDRICAGLGGADDIRRMEELFVVLDHGSLCGLGKSAANPIRSTLRFFREEYDAHILAKKCPAGVCRSLITYTIDPELCTGCLVCGRACPAGAISGEKKEPHVINEALCDRCGICAAMCKFNAIVAR
jgi:NADH:ubiquinone oxidoreductase subunit F (NADH-binding)/NADH:ubiquinone oxidoreductase subunit E/Pyruvate/2-oxoacid:ferredoxin oxidoreductase delta subunit